MNADLRKRAMEGAEPFVSFVAGGIADKLDEHKVFVLSQWSNHKEERSTRPWWILSPFSCNTLVSYRHFPLNFTQLLDYPIEKLSFWETTSVSRKTTLESRLFAKGERSEIKNCFYPLPITYYLLLHFL
ncbi:hypothetical protein H1P_570012 [Hyella patelloides LEGE 07179]|uniref:Uncharacterized protein n=1 Tax=Hyella patelloides LEGE 07179 TaxID=945734 RepID=A0A563W0G7_9CYAN|nr:hypothetical protein [Hyella patelloides]VEP17212.1 hypothetical protein H1P_570012 [Hyella patelloides LEGE 07179]